MGTLLGTSTLGPLATVMKYFLVIVTVTEATKYLDNLETVNFHPPVRCSRRARLA